ncbi:hypothetical protein AB1N83_009689 [Pleurotus pulmonarius]
MVRHPPEDDLKGLSNSVCHDMVAPSIQGVFRSLQVGLSRPLSVGSLTSKSSTTALLFVLGNLPSHFWKCLLQGRLGQHIRQVLCDHRAGHADATKPSPETNRLSIFPAYPPDSSRA